MAQPAREPIPTGGALWIALALALVSVASQPTIAWLFLSDHPRWNSAVIILGSLLYWAITKENRERLPSDRLAGGVFAISAGLLIIAALGGDAPRTIVSNVVFESSTLVWPIVVVLACSLGKNAHAVLALGAYWIAGSLVHMAGNLADFHSLMVLSIAGAIMLAAALGAFAIGRSLRSPHQ